MPLDFNKIDKMASELNYGEEQVGDRELKTMFKTEGEYRLGVIYEIDVRWASKKDSPATRYHLGKVRFRDPKTGDYWWRGVFKNSFGKGLFEWLRDHDAQVGDLFLIKRDKDRIDANDKHWEELVVARLDPETGDPIAPRGTCETAFWEIDPQATEMRFTAAAEKVKANGAVAATPEVINLDALDDDAYFGPAVTPAEVIPPATANAHTTELPD